MEDIINEAASMSEEEKVRLWDIGVRKCNISAATDDKLKRYYNIAKIGGYSHAKSECLHEASLRGIVLCTATWSVPTPADFDEVTFCNKLAKYLMYTSAEKAIKQVLVENDKSGILYTIKTEISHIEVEAINKESIAEFDTWRLAAKIYLGAAYFVAGEHPEWVKDIVSVVEPLKVSYDDISVVLRWIAHTPKLLEAIVDAIKMATTSISEGLEEDIEKHSELNPKLWNKDETLKPEVLEKVNLIVEEFLAGLKDDNIDINVNDVVLVGSNCSYNYTKDSDLDIHIIADTTTLKDNSELYKKLYSAYRTLFNKKLDIEFYNIPVELYIESTGTPGLYNGVYSVLQNKWLSQPVAEDIPEIDKEALNKEVKVWEDRYNKIIAVDSKTKKKSNKIEAKETGTFDEAFDALNKLNEEAKLLESSLVKDTYDIDENTSIEYGWEKGYNGGHFYVEKNYRSSPLDAFYRTEFHKTFATEAAAKRAFEKYKKSADIDIDEELQNSQITEIDKYLEDIYNLRKEGLASDGQYGIKNLVFKEIRNKGYLDKLKDLKNELIGKELSLESLRVEPAANTVEDDKMHEPELAYENLDTHSMLTYKTELSRLAYNQAIVQPNGLFNIYNVKEADVDRITNRIRNLAYIEWVNKIAGRFDFTTVGMPHYLQPRYYTITGKIKDTIDS